MSMARIVKLKKTHILSLISALALPGREAFCFYYRDNLEFLEKQGAEDPLRFSPIHDKHLPEDLDGLLLGGGYPELYGKALEENKTMRK